MQQRRAVRPAWQWASGKRWLRRPVAVLAAVLSAAALTLVAVQQAQADTGQLYTPAPLLNEAALGNPSGGPYVATDAQLASLHNLENQAVQNTLADHGLPASDAAAAQSWGRYDAEAELWALMVSAINTPAAQRSTDQQNAVAWLTTVQQRQDVAAARDAGLEYAKWSGIGAAAYNGELQSNPSAADLTSFLSPQPVNYGRDMHRGQSQSTSNEGYCVYTPPAPLTSSYTANIYTPSSQSTAPQNCYVPCAIGSSCSPPTPSYDQFVQWGLADANAPFNTLSWAAANAATETGAIFGASVAGATLVGSETSAALGLAEVPLEAALAEAAVAGGTSAALAGAQAAQMVSMVIAGAGGIAAIVIAAIAIAVTESVSIAQNLALPGKLAQLVVNAQSATPDLTSVLADPNQELGLYGLFTAATLPDPTFSSCPNNVIGTGITPCLNAPAIPAATADDPQFSITQRGAKSSTTAKTISWADSFGDTDNTARISGNWWVTTATSNTDGSQLTRQTLQIRYTDWGGVERYAWIYGNPTDGYRLITAAPATGVPVDPNTCAGNGTCTAGPSIQYVGTDGQDYTASLTPPTGAPAIPDNSYTYSTTTSETVSPGSPQVGQPATFTATVWDSLVNGGTVGFVAVAPDGTRTALCAAVPVHGASINLTQPGGIPTAENVQQASCAATFDTAGHRDVYATYDGSAADAQSSQASVGVQVSTAAPTTLSISADPAQPQLDSLGSATVTYTATLRAFYPGEPITPTGTVGFTGTGSGCSAQPVTAAGGTYTATCAVTYTSGGTKSMTAIYSGDANTTGSTASMNLGVAPGAIKVQVNAPPAAAPGYALNGTLSATVNGQPVSDFQLTWSGLGANAYPGEFPSACVGSLTTNGVCSWSLGVASSAQPGTVVHAVGHLKYDLGDGSYDLSTTFPVTFTVMNPVTVTMAGSHRYGESTLTLGVASVSPAGAALSGYLFCTKMFPDPLSLGLPAEPIVGTMAPGDYTFDPQSCFGIAARDGAPIIYALTEGNFVVSQGTQTISRFSPPSQAAVGGSTQLTATGGASGNPVTFSVDASSGSGVCSLTGSTVNYLAPGACVIDADQAGNDDYAAASTVSKTITVAKGADTLTASQSADTVDAGMPVTLTAVVGDTAGHTPTGTVAFSYTGADGTSHTVCQSAALSATAPYTATCTFTPTTAGTYTITADYGGDDYLASASGSPDQQLTVNAAQATVKAAASPTAPVVGQPVTVSATVTTSSGIRPTGTVTFADGSTTLCADVALTTTAPFAAGCAFVPQSPGQHPITVSYSGDAGTTAASSNVALGVGKAPTGTKLAASTATLVVGQAVTYTATVAPTTGDATPDGTVTFTDGSTVVCQSVALTTQSPYTASCATTYQATGAHSVSAAYSGSAGTAASTASAVTVTVRKASTSTSLSASPQNPLFGQAVRFTATVAAAPPSIGGPAVTGTVTFAVDGTQLGQPVPVGSGKAVSAPISTLGPGSHSITAVYAGDAAYGGSSGDLAETITCSQTITSHNGPLTVTGSTCVASGGSINGPITVKPGGALSLVGAIVHGPITASGAAGVVICGSTLSGPISISSTAGPVVLGGADGSGCAADTISGPVTISGGQAAVTVAGTHIAGPVTITGSAGVTVTDATINGPLSVRDNDGPVNLGGNTVSGPVTVSGNTSPTMNVISGNTVGGPLSCSGNTPPPIDNAVGNQVRGPATGQCADLA